MVRFAVRKSFSFFGLLTLLGIVSLMPGQGRLPASKAIPGADPYQQGYSSGKTTEDYLQTVLSRDTKPLGLKENVVLRKLLKQPAIKWAIRAGIRHSLD